MTFRATGSFLFGYDSGIISSVISTSYTEFQDYYHHPAANVTGAIVSVFAGGAFCKSIKVRASTFIPLHTMFDLYRKGLDMELNLKLMKVFSRRSTRWKNCRLVR